MPGMFGRPRRGIFFVEPFSIILFVSFSERGGWYDHGMTGKEPQGPDFSYSKSIILAAGALKDFRCAGLWIDYISPFLQVDYVCMFLREWYKL